MADFWAGYISGAASIVIGNPLDLVKVRVQATPSSPSLSQKGTASPGRLPTPTVASAVEAGTTRAAQPAALKGVRDLLAGLPAPIITYGALNALLFWSYNRSLALFPAGDPNADAANRASGAAVYPLYAHFTAGCIAGMASFVFSAPTEVVKCRAQVAAGSYRHHSPVTGTGTSPPVSTTSEVPHTSWAITKSILRNKGIRGLYHGGVITALRDSLGYGFYFLTYEGCTRYLHAHPLWGNSPSSDSLLEQSSTNNTQNGMSEASTILLAGGLAGVATWLSVFPLDVVKTRVQTQPLAVVDTPTHPPRLTNRALASGPQTERTPLVAAPGARPGEPRHYAEPPASIKPLGAWRIAVEAYRNEGVGVFFRGLGVCSLRAFIVNAAQFWVYEWCMKTFTGTAH